MRSFKDFSLNTTGLAALLRDGSQFESVARKMADGAAVADEEEKNIPIYDSIGEAYEALRNTRPKKGQPGDASRTIGAKREPNRRHIAYAFSPIVRKVAGVDTYGRVRLHVLHATKGWKPVFQAGVSDLIPMEDV